jgi:acetyl-CoA carboxylase biotin carboxyl carrier protein
MNTPAAPSQDVFDVRKIRRLVELMKEHDLSEIDLQQGEVRIQLRRACTAGQAAAATAPAPTAAAPAPAASGSPSAAAGAAPESGESAAADSLPKGIALVRSPMVGTFYTAPDPESPAFVKVGDHVGLETTVCIVEAMKVFNQIPAGTTGRILAVLAESGAPVEFGQPLFKVDTRE